MLSKIRCLPPLFQSSIKRTFSKKAQTTQKPNVNKKEEFIDASKFKENILMLYQSKEATSSKVVSLVMASLGIVDFYQWYQSGESFFSNTEALMGLFVFGFLAAFELKLHRTPKSIWLEKDGRSVFVELYRFLGFGSNVIGLEVRDFRGYGPYIQKYSKVPIAKYDDNGTKKFIFIKPGYIVENDLLRKVFHGYDFKVGNTETNINLSKKAKSKYDV